MKHLRAVVSVNLGGLPVDGSSRTQITQPPGWPNQPPYFYDYGPAWSPDAEVAEFINKSAAPGDGVVRVASTKVVKQLLANPIRNENHEVDIHYRSRHSS